MDSLATHTDYGQVPLTEADLASTPVEQFTTWLADAEAAGLAEPNAMVLSTIDPDGVPSSRTVLLRGVDARGFVFYTNHLSRKGRALQANPAASLLFPWYPLQRQVIVTGTTQRLPEAESDAYFASRPHGSQLAAVASAQSQPVASRGDLERRVAELEAQYPEGTAVPRPAHWGGFVLAPSRVEFWKGRTSRLHDRLVYEPGPDASWTITRLQP